MKTIIIVGLMGSGKTTLLKSMVKEHGFNEILQYTSRPQRENEVHGKDYYFVEDEFFFQTDMVTMKKFYARFGVCHYGFGEHQFKKTDKVNILVTDFNSANAIKNFLGSDCYIIFLNPPIKNVRERLEIRGDDVSEVDRRLLADYERFYQYAHRHCDLEIFLEKKNHVQTILEAYLKKEGIL